jgi:hypothetical protein
MAVVTRAEFVATERGSLGSGWTFYCHFTHLSESFRSLHGHQSRGFCIFTLLEIFRLGSTLNVRGSSKSKTNTIERKLPKSA